MHLTCIYGKMFQKNMSRKNFLDLIEDSYAVKGQRINNLGFTVNGWVWLFYNETI